MDPATPLPLNTGPNSLGSLRPPLLATTAMSKDEKFNTPDGDIILRAPGPPSRDFRVHKLVLSLASPVFKDMFSLPRPASYPPSVAEVEIVEVTDPPHALDLILRMIYPFTPPSIDGNLDTLIECLAIADKYEIKGAKARLYHELARPSITEPLRVYAIASRFGFTNIADSASRDNLSTVHLPGIPELPDDFDYVPATEYHKVVRLHSNYRKAVAEIIKQTPLKSKCYNCPGSRSFMEEVFRLRLAHLVLTGTPVEAEACFQAWLKTYGHTADCEESCALKFICSAISRVNGGSVKSCIPPLQKKKALQIKA